MIYAPGARNPRTATATLAKVEAKVQKYNRYYATNPTLSSVTTVYTYFKIKSSEILARKFFRTRNVL